jgi:DNA topoisomerase IA
VPDPALKLIYDNYESLNSAPTLVYKIVGEFSRINSGLSWTGSSDRAEAVAFLEASRHEHLLSVGEKRTTRKQPPKPLNTSRLLQVSSNTLGIPRNSRCPSPSNCIRRG